MTRFLAALLLMNFRLIVQHLAPREPSRTDLKARRELKLGASDSGKSPELGKARLRGLAT